MLPTDWLSETFSRLHIRFHIEYKMYWIYRKETNKDASLGDSWDSPVRCVNILWGSQKTVTIEYSGRSGRNCPKILQDFQRFSKILRPEPREIGAKLFPGFRTKVSMFKSCTFPMICGCFGLFPNAFEILGGYLWRFSTLTLDFTFHSSIRKERKKGKEKKRHSIHLRGNDGSHAAIRQLLLISHDNWSSVARHILTIDSSIVFN